MTMYGLPSPTKPSNEFEYYKQKFNPEEQDELFRQLCDLFPMNEEQQHLFDVVTEAASVIQPNERMKGIFCHASAGCGKTATAKKIAAYARSKGIVTCIVSSTALSSQNYLRDGTTAHSEFGVPVVEDFDRDVDDEPLRCSVSPDRAEFINETTLIIWDEALGNHMEVFLAAMRKFNNFKGKVILFLTDLKQTLPVIQDGSKEDILAATILNCTEFQHFIKVSLDTNMRLRNATEENRIYLQFIDAIGKNEESPLNKIVVDCYDQDIKYHAISNNLKCFFDFSELPDENDGDINDDNITNDGVRLIGDELNNFLFRVTSEEREAFLNESGTIHRDKAALFAELLPNGYSREAVRDISILAFSNKEVDAWNDEIASLNPETEVIKLSRDWFTEVLI